MSDFGIRELYDVNIRTSFPMEFCGREYEENEIILRLDRIGIAAVGTSKTRVTATGGLDNKALIVWESVNPMRMQIQQGIISKTGLSLLSNNLLKTEETVAAPITESFETVIGATEGKLKKLPLRHKPQENTEFVYQYKIIEDTKDKNKKEIITKLKREKGDYEIKTEVDDRDKENVKEFYFLELSSSDYDKIVIDYYSDKSNSEVLRIGQNLLGGFLKLEAKTRVKDDITGDEKTGIFVIPKMKIVSDLSMRLGDAAQPFVYNFMVEGYPVGPRGEQYVGDLVFLDEDLDVDI